MKIHAKYNSIDIFNNKEVLYLRKESNKIISWITILIIGSIVLFLIMYFYKFKIFSIYNGVIIKNEEENYIKIEADEEFLKYKNRNYYRINEKKYRCHIKEIADSYYIDKKYYSVLIKCDLEEEININNNIVDVRVDEKETTLFKLLIKRIKKGVLNARVKN